MVAVSYTITSTSRVV